MYGNKADSIQSLVIRLKEVLNGESVERHGTVQARWREWLLWEIWKNLGAVHHACQWAVDKMPSTTPLQPLPSAVFLDAFWKDGKDGPLSTRQETEALDKARNRAEDGAKLSSLF